MKKLKMLTSILLALVLCLSFVLPVNAVNVPETSTDNTPDGAYPNDTASEHCGIIITDQVAGHKFVAYRIFAADLNVADGVKTLSNIQFADPNTEQDMLDAINLKFDRSGTEGDNKIFTEAYEVADFLSSDGNNTVDNAIKFADAVKGAIGEDNEKYELTFNSTNSSYSVSNMKPGYYLILDEKDGGPENGATDSIYSRYILQVAGKVTIKAKIEGQPTLDKFVGKKVYSGTDYTIDYEPEDNMNDDGKNNTANIGDSVPFRIEIKFPNLDEYKSYNLEVTDTLSAGFEFENNVTMKIVTMDDGEDGDANRPYTIVKEVEEADYTVTEAPEKSGNIKITFNKICDKYKDYYGKYILIEYSAKLTEDALGNQEANTNKAKLTYSNNPRETGSYGTTPEVTTNTYTFNVTINKVDFKKKDTAWGSDLEKGDHYKNEEGAALSDVTFKLYRVTSEAKTEDETSEQIMGPYEDGKFKTNSAGQIHVDGLANGTYYLKEIDAHNGYNRVLGKIYFTISAKYDTTENKVVVKSPEDLEADIPEDSVKNVADIGVVPNNFETKNEIWLLVTNSTGAQLPSTGGIGTVIFTVVGLLVMGAVVVIAVKSNKK